MEDNCLYYKTISKNGKITYTPCKVLCEPDSLSEDILEHPDMRALLDKLHSTYEVVAKTIAIINDLSKKNNESNS